MTPGPLARYVIFAALAVVVAGAVALVGGMVALDRGGNEAAHAWRLGCLATLIASLLGGLLVCASGRMHIGGVTLALGSMLVRLAVLGLLGSALAVLLDLASSPFLLAIALSYLALLVVDTGYALIGSGSEVNGRSQ